MTACGARPRASATPRPVTVPDPSPGGGAPQPRRRSLTRAETCAPLRSHALGRGRRPIGTTTTWTGLEAYLTGLDRPLTTPGGHT